ncbi:MATE family efflux transporter [Anaerovorax odorimutans]|uniref:MATE family efflux transporter n=1 Tax=Anaerovorax odorimutans TaxID=109327 RepID=A0ABT1RIZ1_9FIRM|nr:MATE family efflux transporter [Anaerovorax odorimutans]MCQ4635145.1 MATE family efflux transporter [Anaerovorax odorimutans]
MLHKEFFRYVIPSMIAFAFSGVYSIVDGWFIGNYMGEIGLAAINVAYPLTTLIQATGTGLGMGGAILISISRGKGEPEAQKEYMGITIGLLVVVGILEMILLYAFYGPILRFFGASGEILTLGSEYIRWIIYGTMFQIIGTGLVPIARNYNGAVVAMVSMVCGFVANVILDWLFIAVLGYGMTGAAAATVCGQGLAIVPSLIFLIREKKLFGYMQRCKNLNKLREIVFVAASPFGLTLSPNIILIIINKNAILHGGARAAACYAVVCYVTYIVQMLLQGVGDGSQPLISRYYGLGDMSAVKKLRRMAYLSAEFLALISLVLLILLRRPIAVFFGMEAQGVEDAAATMPIFAAGFVFIAVLRVTTSCFYAIKKNIYAYILIYGEPIGVGILAGILLPPLFGITGVWLSVPVTQVILAALAMVLLKLASGRERKFINNAGDAVLEEF